MPKIVNHTKRREEVAAAVLAVVGRVGVGKATLREVAREASCTTGMLSHYFRDKNELMVFAFRLVGQRSQARLDARLKRLSGLAALRAALEEVVPLDEERRQITAVWMGFAAQAVTEPELAEVHRRAYDLWRQRLQDLLRTAAEVGEIDPNLDLELEAHTLSAFMLGLARQALLDPERFPPEQQLAMIDAVLARLAARRVRSSRGVPPAFCCRP